MSVKKLQKILGEQDYYAMFNNTFDEYRCDSPSNFTFVDPQG